MGKQVYERRDFWDYREGGVDRFRDFQDQGEVSVI